MLMKGRGALLGRGNKWPVSLIRALHRIVSRARESAMLATFEMGLRKTQGGERGSGLGMVGGGGGVESRSRARELKEGYSV